MTTLIEVINHGPIRELRLARPPVNALDTDLCRQLIHAIELAMAEDAHGIVLSAASASSPAAWTCRTCSRMAMTSTSCWTPGTPSLAPCAPGREPHSGGRGDHRPRPGGWLRAGAVLRLPGDGAQRRSVAPYAIGLNEVQVGLIAPEGIQRLLRRAAGVHRAGALLTTGALVPAEQALQIGLVDELAEGDRVVARAVAWLQNLLRQPRQPMLLTRAIARADLHEALHRPDPAGPLRRAWFARMRRTPCRRWSPGWASNGSAGRWPASAAQRIMRLPASGRHYRMGPPP
jgi:hypothetical protein